MTRRLENRHALLTGALGGVGLAVTTAYLAQGPRCTAVDVAREPARELAALIAQHREDLDKLVEALLQREELLKEEIDAILQRHKPENNEVRTEDKGFAPGSQK